MVGETSESDDIVTLLQALIQHPTEDPPGREIELARFVHGLLGRWGIEEDLVRRHDARQRRADDSGELLGAADEPREGSPSKLSVEVRFLKQTVLCKPFIKPP